MATPRTRKDESVTAPDGDASAESKAPATAEDKPGPVEDKDSGTAYLNTTNGPLVYTENGHLVAAGAWTPATRLDKIGRRLRDSGYLRPRSAL